MTRIKLAVNRKAAAVRAGLRPHGKTTLHFDPDVVGHAAKARPQLVRALKFIPHIIHCHSSPLTGQGKLSCPLNGHSDFDQRRGRPAREPLELAKEAGLSLRALQRANGYEGTTTVAAQAPRSYLVRSWSPTSPETFYA
jgi:hypothetical protein